MTLIDQIRDLIAEGETQRSLDELYKYVKESNADVIDNLVMLRSRMQNLQRAVHNGTMDDHAAALERAKINEAILKLLPQLTPEYLAEASKRKEPIRHTAAATATATPSEAPARDMKKMYLIGGGALLVVILLIVMLTRGGGDSEEGQQAIAADSTAATLPNASSGNVAQQTTGSKSQPQTGGQTAQQQQNFQQQQPQTQQNFQQQQPQTQQDVQQQQPQTKQVEDDLSAEWQSNNGSATFSTEDGTNWNEMENGVVKFKFKMKKETAEYVEIYDASRGITLRLYDDMIQFQWNGGESEWNVLAYGGWK